MTLPLALSPHAEIMFQAATLGIFLVVSTAIWTWVFVRWRDGRPIIPLARRRPVPWSGLDVLFIFLMAFFLPISLGRAVETWLGSSADQQAPGPGTDLAHPAERLLGSRDPAAIVVALAMAVVVAPLSEEFLFRVLLQGWLEAVWQRRRRERPELRRATAWRPLLLPAVLFAAAQASALAAPAGARSNSKGISRANDGVSLDACRDRRILAHWGEGDGDRPGLE